MGHAGGFAILFLVLLALAIGITALYGGVPAAIFAMLALIAGLVVVR